MRGEDEDQVEQAGQEHHHQQAIVDGSPFGGDVCVGHPRDYTRRPPRDARHHAAARSREGRPPCERLASRGASGQAAQDGVDQHAGDVDLELLLQFPDAGRAGDVDLGDEPADDVQTDEHHAALAHDRPDA